MSSALEKEPPSKQGLQSHRAQSQERGGETRRVAVTQGELVWAVRRTLSQQLDEYLLLSARQNRRCTAGALQNNFQCSTDITVRTKCHVDGMRPWHHVSAPCMLHHALAHSSLYRWEGSHWAQVTDVKESGDTVANIAACKNLVWLGGSVMVWRSIASED